MAARLCAQEEYAPIKSLPVNKVYAKYEVWKKFASKLQ